MTCRRPDVVWKFEFTHFGKIVIFFIFVSYKLIFLIIFHKAIFSLSKISLPPFLTSLPFLVSLPILEIFLYPPYGPFWRSPIPYMLSDCHSLPFTLLKMHFCKEKRKVNDYRNHKNFNNNHFRADLFRKITIRKIKTEQLGKFKWNFLTL